MERLTEKRAIYEEDILAALRDDPQINGANFARVKRHVNEMSTVDAVEVVRCKECVSGHEQYYGGLVRCNVMGCGGLKPDDFCAYGKRRDGE